MGQVIVLPNFTVSHLVRELGCGEVAEAVDLVFDGHGEDFDVADEEILWFGW